MRAIPRVIRIRPPRQALLRRFQSTFPAKPLREIPKYFEREENFRGNAPTRPPALLRPEAEQQWLEYWDALPKKSIFEDPQKPTIRMLLPPPNVTGELHMGHATMLAVQDSLARYYRMNGHKVEWRPGTDHAGIATQGVVERWLAEKNGEMVTRHDLGREGLLKKIEEWREKYGARILEQMHRMGITTDKDKLYYTLSEDLSTGVKRAFVELHKQGLIYRSTRMVNWSVALQTAISDIEVEYLDLEKPKHAYRKGCDLGYLHEFSYKLVEDPSREIVVATTRPETVYGDRAVAVHPDDPRYQDLHYKLLQHPLLPDVQVPVIPDAVLVDPKFGTGAVKITPAHDVNDYEFWQRHSKNPRLTEFPLVSAYGIDGKMLPSCGHEKIIGMDRLEARGQTIGLLKASGAYKGKKAHPMRVGICSRTGDIIEPVLVPQWYLQMKPLADKVLTLQQHYGLRILPDRFMKEWTKWLEDIKDWCLSRQIWWGHRIPAYQVLSREGQELRWVVAETEEEAMSQLTEDERASGCTLKQDDDVLDTWFSSGLLPLTTAGWKGSNDTLTWRENYPLTFMETGNDILFFWVARMAMLCSWFSGELPFNDILLHPLVCDKQGRKMSKSVGNVLDPLALMDGRSLDKLIEPMLEEKALVEQRSTEDKARLLHDIDCRIKLQKAWYPNGIKSEGTDAVRLALIAYSKRSQINLFLPDVNFWTRLVIKLENATRFLHMCFEKIPPEIMDHQRPDVPDEAPPSFEPHDIYMLVKLRETIDYVNQAIVERRLADAVEQLHDFIRHTFCDYYIEFAKDNFSDALAHEDMEVVATRTRHIANISLFGMDIILRLMHPFAPFMTEDLWQRLEAKRYNTPGISILTHTQYPLLKDIPAEFPEEQDTMEAFESVVSIINRLRTLREKYNIGRARMEAYQIIVASTKHASYVNQYRAQICRLGKVPAIYILDADATQEYIRSPGKDEQFEWEKGSLVGIKFKGSIERDKIRQDVYQEVIHPDRRPDMAEEYLRRETMNNWVLSEEFDKVAERGAELKAKKAGGKKGSEKGTEEGGKGE